MRTQIIEVSPDEPASDALEAAAAAVRAGKVVAIPTETLYVLVADPFNLNAVAEVFRAKGRELHRSLPILVDSTTMVEEYAEQPLSSRFYLLARRFWPGPLTMIVPSSFLLPLKVTGNSGRLAARHARAVIPNKLIERLEMPIIATSANLSGKPTCRSGVEVFGRMDGRLDLILDAGAVTGGPATTIDITAPEWKVIREGAVLESQLRDCLEASESDEA